MTSGGGGSPPPAVTSGSAILDAGTFAAGSAPILMYHAISDVPPGAAYSELYVTPDDFAAEMAWLRSEGFEAVTLDDLYGAWHGKGNLPPKPIVISFDDGLQSQFTEALPIMRDMGWPGVLNLKIESLDQRELTYAMVQRMIDAGWEIDSHTINHVDVTQLDAPALEHELADSRRILQERFGVAVDFFCFPSGRFDRAAIAAVRDAGYVGATTTLPGLATPSSNPFKLDRIRVELADGVPGLSAKLSQLAASS